MDARWLTWMLMVMAVCSTATAQIYKTVDENGSVTFSDTPSTGSEEVEQQTLPSINTTSLPTSEIESAGSESTPFQYQLIEITSPKNDHSFVNTDGNFNVTVMTSPGLRGIDSITLLLDGKPYGPPQNSLSFSITNLDRGAHTIAAQIMGPNNNVLASSKLITIYIRRNTILLPAPARPSSQ